MRLPHFLGLGAAKAGTTSLRHYLIAHPDVFVVRAEPRFFASENKNLDTKHPSHHQTVPFEVLWIAVKRPVLTRRHWPLQQELHR